MTDGQHPWGRVGDGGTVYVLDGDVEREVGQYPDATPDEAIAYFERKFTELEGQVSLLEQRVKRGASVSDVAPTVARLTETLADANAVGDLASLRERVGALGGKVEELTEQQSAEAAEAVEAAVAERTAIVVEVETLAGQDPAKIQWKQTTAQLDALFQRWQSHQQTGPRIPKGTGNELWKRFRDARAKLDSERRAFFAELDETHKDAKNRKQRLVDRAEALAPKGAAGIPDYRTLLDEWKRAGRAGKKVDDALWAQFKAAGDVLYGAKAEVDARESEEFGANLEQKLELLTEAETLLEVTNRAAAREKLLSIQKRWDAIGKVPRDRMRDTEDRLRRVEAHVKKLDDDHWRRTDPEKEARSSGLTAQLQSAIAQLEDDLASAKKTGDAKRIAAAQEALDARRSWLAAIGG